MTSRICPSVRVCPQAGIKTDLPMDGPPWAIAIPPARHSWLQNFASVKSPGGGSNLLALKPSPLPLSPWKIGYNADRLRGRGPACWPTGRPAADAAPATRSRTGRPARGGPAASEPDVVARKAAT